MSILTIVLLSLSGICLLVSAGYARYTNRTVQRMDCMLDAAMAGEFHEHIYDENIVSRLEQKLSRVLTQCKLTSGAVETERTRVQALIGDISHQTKTPLANILLYVQLLEEEPLCDTTRPLCNQIGAQTEKLQFLIGALVKTSRLESGAVQVHPNLHLLGELLEAIQAQYSSAAAAKGITLEVASTSLTASFDPRWTTEAVGNVVDNAIKYTPAGGTVTVTAEESSLFSKLTVYDTGPGIPEEEHAAVFERFYRGRNATAEGVGVGLYLTRQIISAEGGYLRLRSVLGEGCAFSIYLPH